MYGWGTNLPYMISGAANLPQGEVMDWLGKNRYSVVSILRALHSGASGSFDEQVFKPVDAEMVTLTSSGEVMILGGGPSVARHLLALARLVKRSRMPVMHANMRNLEYMADLGVKQIICLALSPALQIIGKMKDTLMGRAIGILIADGSDGAVIAKIKAAATNAGATVKIVAPKVGGAKLANGAMLAVDGQLAGTPSVLFDAVAVILSDEGAKALSMEGAAIDFVRDAFGHLKAIAVDKGGQVLLKKANVGQDAGVVNTDDKDAFIAAAKTRQWDREKLVRTLA